MILSQQPEQAEFLAELKVARNSSLIFSFFFPTFCLLIIESHRMNVTTTKSISLSSIITSKADTKDQEIKQPKS